MIMHVAVGIYITPDDKFLVCKRPDGKPWAGLWEFPGGKIESGEAPAAALCREWQEELAVQPTAFDFITTIAYAYPNNTVCLHIFHIKALQGKIKPIEGQEICFIDKEILYKLPMLPANRYILARFVLSSYYYMTATTLWHNDNWQQILKKIISKGIKQIRLRQDDFDDRTYAQLVAQCSQLCQEQQALLMIDSVAPQLLSFAAGAHLAVKNWAKLTARPCGFDKWLGMSVHNNDELKRAQALGCDFVTLSPINSTASYPNKRPLGWEKLRTASANNYVAIYALGGISPQDLPAARANGAFGVAGISGFM